METERAIEESNAHTANHLRFLAQLRALTYLLDSQTEIDTQTVPIAHEISRDADYVVAYNALKAGYTASIVIAALSSEMLDRDYDRSSDELTHISQAVSRAEAAITAQAPQLQAAV